MTGLAKRRLVDVVEARLAEEPVVVLNGPRTVGKGTRLSQLGERLKRSVIDCDDPATRSAVRDDPARFVESDQLAGRMRQSSPGTSAPKPATRLTSAGGCAGAHAWLGAQWRVLQP